MIYAYEEGMALHLTARSDKGVFDLFTDDTGESLFTFADADIDKLTELMARYFRSRIDLEKLECLEPEEDLLPEIHERFLSLHPFFHTADHASALPDMLAASMNQMLKDRDVSEEKYHTLLHHLTGPALNPCFSDTQYMTAYHDSLIFEKRNYEEYQKKDMASIQHGWNKRGITSLSSLQRYVQLYLYWVLDASAERFNDMDMDARLKLFSRVFGSVNQWQPLAIREVSCVGVPDKNTISDILRRGQWSILDNLDKSDAIAEATRKSVSDEVERKEYADAMKELTSDNLDLDADMSRWLKKRISEIEKETSQPLFKAYEISCFSDYILLQLRLMTEKAVVMKRCKNCGQYFITERPNIDYCQRILPGETQSCFVIGPKRVFNKNLAADIPRGLYSKAYKKYQARLRRGAITEESFNTWKESAKRYLDDVQRGVISLSEYTEWMEQ